jgi:hypothetical protein
MNSPRWALWENGFLPIFALIAVLLILFSGCSGGSSGNKDDNNGGAVTGGDYIILAWNDLGMHCLNPTYDQLIILPPYNTLWAQVIQRGNPPTIVTSGVVVSYDIVNNSSSLNKLSYDDFWNAEVLALFPIESPPLDKGLNLRDPTIHNGLSGTMQQIGDHFQADGIPVTPVDDDGVKDPYQVAQITVKDLSGTTLVQTRAMVPTSDEINCGQCHSPGGSIGEVFTDIIQTHDANNLTTLEDDAPILCASCHGSPALGSSPGDRGSAGLYLSEAIHGFHADKTTSGGSAIACYDCHPGKNTQCNRSLAHTASNGNCIICHGAMPQLAMAITNDTKVPWVDEPRCISCHAGIAEVDTGTLLYRNATGHGGVYCAGCHQSPHAMVPSRESVDNYQALQYQDAYVTIGSCAACHSSSKPEGGDIGEFQEKHAGTNPERRSACAVCHTALPANVNSSGFPHQFEWSRR